MQAIYETATDKVEVYASPSERNECSVVAFDVYRKDSMMGVGNVWRETRNFCIAPNLRFGNDTKVDPNTMLIVPEETEGAVGMFDYVRNATPESLGMTALTQNIHDYMATKVEQFLMLNGLIDPALLS